MALKFYTSLAKESRLKFRKILGLIPTFVEATEKKPVGLRPVVNLGIGT